MVSLLLGSIIPRFGLKPRNPATAIAGSILEYWTTEV
jgi:hypothetical protein